VKKKGEVRLTTRAASAGALRGVPARRFGSGYDHIWYQHARSKQKDARVWPGAPVLGPAPWYITSHWAYPNLANIEGIQGKKDTSLYNPRGILSLRW